MPFTGLHASVVALVPTARMVCSALESLEGLSWWVQDGMSNSDFFFFFDEGLLARNRVGVCRHTDLRTFGVRQGALCKSSLSEPRVLRSAPARSWDLFSAPRAA